MKHINDLPEDCFLHLFSHIPLDDLVKIRKVCKIWFFIVRQICARKTSLKLFSSINEVEAYTQELVWYNFYQDNELKFKTKVDKNDDELIGAASLWKLIGYLFPNVQNLVFYDQMNRFSLVLKSMPNLVTLTLRGPENIHMFTSEKTVDEFLRLLPIVNTLKSLKNLNLFAISNFRARFCSKEHLVPLPEIPIFEQLESFSLCNYGSDCSAVLNQLGSNLRKLTLKCLDIKFDDFKFLALSKPQIFKNLTHMSICLINEKDEGYFKSLKNPLEDKKLFHFICENFVQLKYLEFKFYSLFKQDEVLFSLAKLNNLAEFQMHDVWNYSSDSNLITIQLKSVKILHLTRSSLSWDDFPNIEFSKIFPNLEVLNITGYEAMNKIRNYLAGLTCKINFIEKREFNYYMGRHRMQWLEIVKQNEEEEQREERYERWVNGSDSDDYAF